MKTIAVLLGGSGHRDGTEIHEAVFAMHALESQGFKVVCMAPDALQSIQINHRTAAETPVTRNLLDEAARIARGRITSLTELTPHDVHALVIPGGYGAAFNFCNFAKAGKDMEVHPQVARWLEDLYAQKKPIAGICIAPVILGRVLGKHGITLTLGDAPDGEAALHHWGAHTTKCPPGECVVDQTHRILSTPAYMYGDSSMELVSKGIFAMAKALSALLE